MCELSYKSSGGLNIFDTLPLVHSLIQSVIYDIVMKVQNMFEYFYECRNVGMILFLLKIVSRSSAEKILWHLSLMDVYDVYN